MKTDLNIRPMTPQEKIYAELQSSQISQQTGFIGVLVGNFNQQDRDLPMKWNILQEPPIREAFPHCAIDISDAPAQIIRMIAAAKIGFFSN